MKRTSGSLWSDRKVEIVGLGLVMCVILVLIGFTTRALLAPSDSIQIVTLVILVVVTFSYAESTRRIQRTAIEEVEATRQQAEESRRAVEVALTAEKNAMLPIVEVRVLVPIPGGFKVVCRNVGNGPALNLMVLANYSLPDREDYETFASASVSVLPVKDFETPEMNVPKMPEGTLDIEWRFCLEGHYVDIYGRPCRSTMNITTRDNLGSFESGMFFFYPPQDDPATSKSHLS